MENKFINQTIVFFDDDCIMCNSFAQKILKYKSSEEIYFTSLDNLVISDQKIQIPKNTIILYKSGQLFFKSTAVLKILKLTKFPIKGLSFFLIFPRLIRDGFYDFIAKKRYFFGKKDSCQIPSNNMIKSLINEKIYL